MQKAVPWAVAVLALAVLALVVSVNVISAHREKVVLQSSVNGISVSPSSGVKDSCVLLYRNYDGTPGSSGCADTTSGEGGVGKIMYADGKVSYVLASNAATPTVLFLSTRTRYVISGIHIYYNEEYMQGDPNTFSVVGLSDMPKGIDDSDKQIYYAKDWENAYYKGEQILGADPKTFTLIPTGPYFQDYAKDGSRVYYENNEIPGADPKTFRAFEEQPYEGPGDGPYAVDATHVFFKTATVVGADPRTFMMEWGDYAKDARHVYEEGKAIPGADPKTYAFPEVTYACLLGGTHVRMADGSAKRIEDIKIGERILTSGAPRHSAIVTQTIHRRDPIVTINDKLRAAPDEMLYLSDGTQKAAKDVTPGDRLSGLEEPVPVRTVRFDPHIEDTFDLALSGGENFFAEGILVKSLR